MNQICEAVLYDPFPGHAIHLNIQFVWLHDLISVEVQVTGV